MSVSEKITLKDAPEMTELLVSMESIAIHVHEIQLITLSVVSTDFEMMEKQVLVHVYAKSLILTQTDFVKQLQTLRNKEGKKNSLLKLF